MNAPDRNEAARSATRSLPEAPADGTFSVTITAPGAVANRGVFAAMFGNAQFSDAPIVPNSFVYLSEATSPTSTSSLSTTTTAGVGPVDGNAIAVVSVAGFPKKGSIMVVQGSATVVVKYKALDTTNNTFIKTTFPPNSPGIGDGVSVVLPNVLDATISVVSTAGFPSSGTLMVETPNGYSPIANAVVSYTGTTPTSFTGVTGFGRSRMPSGGTVMQPSEPASSMSYLLAPYGQNLPLIDLFPNGPYPDDDTVTATLGLPDPATNGVLSGVMVISVGSAIALPVTGSTASPSVGSPTPATNPDDKFGLFEWGLTQYQLDFDVSEVDQVGFPFQVTTVGQSPPMPADPTLGVGMLRSRRHLFDGFSRYIEGRHARSAAAPFLACAASNTAAPFAVGTRVTAPQDIVGVFEGGPPVALGAVPSGSAGSGSSITAYYAVTAVSASGESMASNIVAGSTGPAASALLVTWQAYPYAASYNLYWSQSSDLSNAVQIASNLTTFSYTDSTPGSHTGSAVTPPINNYKYDPLNRYLTDTIKEFFDYYRPSDPENPTATFVLDDQATATKWTGYTQDVAVGGATYTMLTLTGSAGQWGSQFAGDVLNIYQPLFSSNTDDASHPPAPTWLTAAYSASMSAASMVFGAAGVFGSVIDPASTLPVNDAKNLYNDVVSAFNRGITPRKVDGSWVVLPPSYWASSPQLVSADAVSGGVLATGYYRYAITSVVVDGVPEQGSVADAAQGQIQITCTTDHGLVTGDRVLISGVQGNTNANGTFMATVIDATSFVIDAMSNGQYVSGTGSWLQVTETTRSNTIQVYVDPSSSGVELNWNAINGPGGKSGAGTASGFNVYRSDLANGRWGPLIKLNDTPIANGETPTTSFADYGDPPTVRMNPPFGYYRNGTRSNFYAGYFSRRQVSINGLSYGYPYADKNGQSTNVQMSLPGPTGLQITLLPWKGATKLALAGPEPTAVSGAPFPVTVSALDDSGAVDASYRGMVCFTLADPPAQGATVDGMPMATFGYAFTEADKGTRQFTIGITAGNVQHLTVSDVDEETLAASLAVAVPPKRS